MGSSKVRRLEMMLKELRKKSPPGVTLLTPWVLGSTTSKSESFVATEASLTSDPMEASLPSKRVWMMKQLKLVMLKLLRKLLKNLNAEGDAAAGGSSEQETSKHCCFVSHGEVFSFSI